MLEQRGANNYMHELIRACQRDSSVKSSNHEHANYRIIGGERNRDMRWKLISQRKDFSLAEAQFIFVDTGCVRNYF